MTLAAGTRLGPYEIQAALGAGGMGEVYRARDTRLDRIVAIKVLPAQLSGDSNLRERLEREARAVAALNHPHICTLHDIGHQAPSTGSGQAVDFLVLEFLDGETLAERLTTGALPLNEALAVAIQVTDALDKAHRAGITHRDLKPANIMLAKSGATRQGAPQAKLLDFGLAKIAAPTGAVPDSSMLPTAPPNLTVPGAILGTFQYMAPEQLEGQEADARTDIFAFGVVLYEMITGRKAFEGKTQASLIAGVLEREPRPLPDTLSSSPVLEWILAKCLKKDPAARWQSARDLSDQLRWVLEGSGMPVSLAPAAASAPRGPSGWIIALAVLAAVVVIAASVALATWWRSETETTRDLVRFAVTPPPKTECRAPAVRRSP
jgi:serine/threonine protein kinase